MKLKSIILTGITAASLFAVGCSKDTFDINSNPNDVTDASVTPGVLLPASQQETSRLIAADYWWMGWWMSYGARSGSYQSLDQEESYKFTTSFHNEVWNDLYYNATNYNALIKKAKDAGAGTYEAIGLIMRGHNLQMLVDIYGNIPFSEAFNGFDVPTPKYDKAADVYNAIFNDLDTAIARLNDVDASAPAKNLDIATADLVYKGNVTSWKKFANTLRLRMLVHLHNGVSTTTVAPGVNVADQVAKITSDGFIGAGESAHLNPGFSSTKPQPYYRYYNTNESGSGSQRDHLRANDYSIEYLKVNGDPRINKFYTAASSGQHGIVFGTVSGPTAPTGADLSTIRGTGFSPNGAASRAWILTSVESLFLQAEARERGIITTGSSAADLLTSAVQESFVWLGLTTADANSYLTGNAGWGDVDYTATATGGGLYTILSQKWFALNNIANYEVWTDWRRTDIVYGAAVGFDPGPAKSIHPNADNRIPVRLLYPQSEYNYNATNVGAEGTLSQFTSKIFWDLN